jgi:hypothetical protein
LGLKLEAGKGPLPVFVIDSVQQPSQERPQEAQKAQNVCLPVPLVVSFSF